MQENPVRRKIVCFGGGSGLPELLRGLKKLNAYQITAAVTMFDDGGSSGSLRREHSVLPPGDLRRAFQALSPLDLSVFSRRLQTPEQHTIFNMIMVGIEKVMGRRDYEMSLALLSEALEVEGAIVPISIGQELLAHDVGQKYLCAEFENGMSIRGEVAIDEYMNQYSSVTRLYLDPAVPASQSVLKAIKEAEFLCFGPGSFYTSILVTLLPTGIREAIAEVRAPIVYIANLMTEGIGMQGMTVASMTRILESYVGRGVDHVVANTQRPGKEVLAWYKEVERKEFLEVGPELVDGHRRYWPESLWLLQKGRRKTDKEMIRHDHEKLGQIVFEITHRL